MTRRRYEPAPSRPPSDHPLWPAFQERIKNMHTTGEMLHIWWEMFLAGANAGARATAKTLAPLLPEPKQEFIQNDADSWCSTPEANEETARDKANNPPETAGWAGD